MLLLFRLISISFWMPQIRNPKFWSHKMILFTKFLSQNDNIRLNLWMLSFSEHSHSVGGQLVYLRIRIYQFLKLYSVFLSWLLPMSSLFYSVFGIPCGFFFFNRGISMTVTAIQIEFNFSSKQNSHLIYESQFKIKLVWYYGDTIY